jgi:two-component sensor histidine kinase
LTLAMLFHELATNAAKLGALLNGAAGKIDMLVKLSQPRGVIGCGSGGRKAEGRW